MNRTGPRDREVVSRCTQTDAPGRAEHGRWLRALATALEAGHALEARLSPWEELSDAEREAFS